jgi:hypothetical protein
MAMHLSQKRSDTSAPQTSAPSQNYSRPFVVPTQTQEEAVQATPEPGVSLLNNRYQVSATPKYQSGWIARAQAASQARSLGIQAKLTIGQPNDKYEQEADSVAEQVMSMPDTKAVQREEMPGEEEEVQTKSLGGSIQRDGMPEEEEEIQTKPLSATITSLVQREAMPEEEEEIQAKSLGGSIQREAVAEEEEEPIQAKLIQREAMGEEEEEIQAKRSSGGGVEAGGDFESRLGSSKSGGSPLPEDVRSFMEPRFGADFSGVRVHTGSESVQMNKELQAQAFAHGSDVYYGAGKAPGNDALTAHELTHVVQQTQNQLERFDTRQRSGKDQPLIINRQPSKTSGLHLLSSGLFSMIQCKKENEKALGDIQGLAMFDLLPRLHTLTSDVRTDEEAGRFVGGPRLLTAIHAVKYKAEGKVWSKFIGDYHNELVSLKYEDQISDVMKFLGANDKDIKVFVDKYVKAIAVGWAGVKTGPNAQAVKVGGKGQKVGEKDDGIRRIPLQIDSSKQAIVLFPAKLNPTASIDVLLHLHGHNVGHTGDSLDSVRDIQKDQIEQQLLASGHNQMVTILPQGSNTSVFQGVNTTTYVGSVFTALNNLDVWGKDINGNPILVKAEGHRVILSAHSGGGAHLSSLLEQSGKPTNPGGLEELFLFDSINAMAIPKKNLDGSIAKDEKGKPISSGIPDVNGSTELKRIRAFVEHQLNLELEKLDKLKSIKDQLDFLEKSGFRVRGYHTPGWYAQIYAPLVQDINDWFKKGVTKKLPSLDQKVIDRWANNYIIQPVNAVSKVGPVGKGHQGHDYIVGQGIPASSKDYDPAKGGALQDALSSIQPKLAVDTFQSLVQRQGASAGGGVTDAQQWDNDWNTHTGQQHYFAGADRPAGTPRHRYDVLCPLYKAHGIPRPMVYMATSITTAKFYNFSTPAHANLAAALATAESTLKTKGYTTAPVRSLWALNPRTTSAGGWSNHADGKAVDIDPNDNPHLIEQKERKIITLVTGTDMEKGGQGYDVMKGASDGFKSDYNAAGLNRRITELTAAEKGKEMGRDAAKSERDALKGQRDTLQTERNRLNQQLKTIPTGKKATPDDLAKAAALKADIQQKGADFKQVQTNIKQKDADLKKEESELKSATQDRKTLQTQLTTYQATEKAIADLESSVKSLPSEITAIEAQINQSKQDEQDAKAKKDFQGITAHQKLQAKFQQSLKQKKFALKNQQGQLDAQKKRRDADPLRNYAKSGFLNLPKDLVEAMTGAGLKWGGDWKGAKDFMHFELP